MTKEYLLDASALLALIKSERRAELLLQSSGGSRPIIDRSAIHTVQVAEVVKKLVDGGVGPDRCREWLDTLDLEVLTTFEVRPALNTAPLSRKEMKLSLGDRICLSVALANDMIAVTTDRQWKVVAGRYSELELKVLLLK